MAYGPTLKNTSNRTSKLKWLLIAVVVLAVLGIGGFFGYRWYLDSKTEDPAAAQEQQESNQDDTVSVRDNLSEETSSPSPSGSPISSVPIQEQQAATNTGITITSPKANATVTNGTKLEGSAPTNYASVSYRIQSDERGLVGQGDLKIVNGKYSGTIGSGGASGAGFIEVFVVDANGREQKHTKVVVSFGG